MKDKKHTPDLMGQVLGAKKKELAPIAEKDMQTKLISLRILEIWEVRLKTHFKSKGVVFSSGLRLAISEYMEREGLI